MKTDTAIPRILLSATGSNCGKTTMTAALLAAFCARNMLVQSYKSGPDYIDPMFHAHITGKSVYHTDPFFLQRVDMQQLVSETAQGADLVLIEGAMGYYDGIGQTSEASAYTVSEWLEAPTLLVVCPQGMGCSTAAVCKGFLNFRQPNQIRGILLNRVRSGMYKYYQELLERETGIPVLGYLPELPEVHLESRHLGLMTAGEVSQLEEKVKRLGAAAEQTIELDRILELAGQASPLPSVWKRTKTVPINKFRLGIAKDTAFCFYYAENLELLEQCGAQLIPFSPLEDGALPEHLDGLYLGGGYPELHLQALSENHAFLQSLRHAAAQKIPILAECGGFLYLQEGIWGEDDVLYPMAGILPGTARVGSRLCRFGYVTLTAQRNTILGKAGTTIRGHEFHYADSTENGDAFLSEKPTGKQWHAMHCTEHITAGFPHLYFPSNPEVPACFAVQCRRFQERENRPCCS